MKTGLKLAIVVSFLFTSAALVSVATADVVYLKDGSEMHGTVLEQDANGILKLKAADGSLLFYSLDEVRKVSLDAESAAATTATTTPAVTYETPGSATSSSSQVDMTATKQKSTYFGIKAGMFSPGTIYVNNYAVDSEMSYSIGGFVDYKLGPKMTGGLYIDIENMSAYEESQSFYDLGFSLKALIQGSSSSVIFRPGLGIGMGLMSGNSEIDGSSYAIIKGIFEVVFTSASSVDWLAEFSLLGAVSGGNADFEATFGPGFTVRAGALF